MLRKPIIKRIADELRHDVSDECEPKYSTQIGRNAQCACGSSAHAIRFAKNQAIDILHFRMVLQNTFRILPLKRRKQDRTVSIVFQNELDGFVAKAAHTVV